MATPTSTITITNLPQALDEISSEISESENHKEFLLLEFPLGVSTT